MRTVRKCVMVLVLCSVLVAGCLSAHADDRSLPQLFIKCDSLLGKSTKAVLATLGQPDQAATTVDATIDPHPLFMLSWRYVDHDPSKRIFEHSVELLFFPNHTLGAVIYDGFGRGLSGASENGFKDGGKSTVIQVLQTYNLSTFQVGYRELAAKLALAPGDAATKRVEVSFLLKAKTRNNNNFETSFFADAISPFVLNHAFDATTGLYKDTYSRNDKFEIDQDGSLGVKNLVIWSPLVNSRPTPSQRLIRAYILNLMHSADISISDEATFHFVPVTSRNIPWLYSTPTQQ